MQYIPKNLIRIARTLRKNQTPWESELWQYLRANRFYGVKFKRQARLGRYIVDFYSASAKLVVELDGGHHNEVNAQKADIIRQEYLESQGYRVLRFWNNELGENMNGVLEKIREVLLFKTPPALRASSPRQERVQGK